MLSRETIINHILFMKQHDIEYARYALQQYATLLPWLDLNQAVKAAMGERCE